jgi:hypothetical protein
MRGTQSTDMTGDRPTTAPSATRRRFLASAGAAALAPTAVAVLGGPLSGIARAAGLSDGLQDFAPIPMASLGPPLNADGYYVGRIRGNLYWVTDSIYISMFLSTQKGVVLVDAPPTIGHNVLRAIDDVTKANGRPSKVTYFTSSPTTDRITRRTTSSSTRPPTGLSCS